MSAEFNQLVAQFEQFQAKLHRVDQQFADLGQMQRELTELEAVATSADREVTVVAGPSGTIKDIRLTDQAMHRPPQALATALMATLRQAVAESARRQAGIVENALGDEMGLTEQVLETQAQLFGVTPQELRAMTEQAPGQPPAAPPAAGPGPQTPSAPPARPTPPRRPAPAEEADDFSQRGFLRDDQQPRRPQADPGQKRDDRFLNLYDDEGR
ncbi:YbaB/EbfC family nucleoid-associated protein [Actinosynnema pretiosum subsp. pretiosum]|uniref:YbaB/EbfC family nucleoid-associated protein n=1 Tax=Actinosynnema pretiosum subsp. pretiosum TaxID=103721 RepID=A0AA45R519_9PSEU|nr:hypothetical protein APASM_3119 [Actinosynnema pretiosum subsp. pretiosum]QUF05374.1 YbaB/EbfC family nucleoid-associated protein [Actinosynnema pretiosum subsp. pretiosum]